MLEINNQELKAAELTDTQLQQVKELEKDINQNLSGRKIFLLAINK